MPHLKFNCHLQQKNLCNIIAAWSIWLDVRRLPIRRGEIWLRGVQTRQWNEMSSFCRDGGKQNVNFSIGNSSNIVNANWIRPKKQYFVNIIYWRINHLNTNLLQFWTYKLRDLSRICQLQKLVQSLIARVTRIEHCFLKNGPTPPYHSRQKAPAGCELGSSE